MSIFELPLAQLRRRSSMKWRAYGDEVLPLWVAEMDCRPAPAVAERLARSIAEGDTGYPFGTDYEQAYAEFAADVWGWDYPAEERTIIVPDVMQGIIAVLDLLARSTRGGSTGPVVVNPPVYPQFFKYLQWGERPVVQVPLAADGHLDLAGLRTAFAADATPEAYLLCNPQNPHGTVFTVEELSQAVALADEYGVRVISDEIHAPLVAAPTGFTPLLSVAGSEEHVTVTSASKAWNLAGLKAAVAIGGERVAPTLLTMPDQITHSASHLGALAHVTALREGREWLNEAVSEIAANKVLLADLLATELPAIGFTPGPATYLAWLDCRGLGLADPQQTFLAGGVAFNNGKDFGIGGADHVRMNLATSPELITEAVRRMVASL